MIVYLTANPPARPQWYQRRNRPLTGCTVLHDAENVMDSIGPDTGAESVAEFIRNRTTAGSYHDLVDSDSGIHLVEYEYGAFHDGTGSNNWALSLSFACRTVDWARMTAAKRHGFLRQGALRFVAQQQWRRSTGAPLTRLRYISKAQSDAGQSGFCCHGWRDPARRTDPGTRAPNLFPFDEFLDACRVALAELMPDHPDATALEDDMADPEVLAELRFGNAQAEAANAKLDQLGEVLRLTNAKLDQLGDVARQEVEMTAAVAAAAAASASGATASAADIAAKVRAAVEGLRITVTSDEPSAGA